MAGLKGTKMAALLVGVGIAVGVVVSFAIISSQNQENVFARVVEDTENPFLDPEYLKTYQTSLRTGAHYKSEVVVGQEAFFVSDVKGGKQPYTFEWKFGDGVVLTVQNATRTFDAPGTYHFDLTVTDADGKKAGSTGMTVNVRES
ncbi:MAG: PKD domain-containing protein [Nitrososphaera sp.]